MTDVALRRSIQQALAACASGPLAARVRDLLGLLGYQSERWVVERILALKAENPQADVRELEREIDERVYGLYGLRPDEIRMYRGAGARAWAGRRRGDRVAGEGR